MDEPQTAAPAPARSLPLARLHRRLEAELVPFAGWQVPWRYAEVGAEHRALTTGAALVDRSWAARLELKGADARRFLNGLVTCDVKTLAAGGAVYGFFTGGQGKILADVTVLAFDDRLWLELPPGTGEEISTHLGKYLIADRVEVLPLDDLLPISLAGPRAGALLAGVTEPAGPAGALWRHARLRLLGSEVCCLRHPLAGGEAFTLWISASIARLVVEELLDRLGGEGLAPAGLAALEARRVEAGVPRFGADFGRENFPQETGLDELEGVVSYTKGCYLGQEVVARIHYRGGVNKTLCGLRFDGEAPPAAGTPLLAAGREAGSVGSAVASPALGGRPIGLAILHRRAAEPGTRLELAGGAGAAEVSTLPFVPAAAT